MTMKFGINRIMSFLEKMVINYKPGFLKKMVKASLLIVYYSKSGNTKKMAEAIADGARTVKNVEVVLKTVEEATNKDLVTADCIILGSPSYFRLPAWPVKKFIDESVEVFELLKGKKGGVFASAAGKKGAKVCLQGLKDMLEEHGIIIVRRGLIGLIVKGRPSVKDVEVSCKEYGAMMARTVCEV